MEFSAWFKALIHDVGETDYQRIVYLKMYLAPNVCSSIAGLLCNLCQYWKVFQTFSNRYGNPLFIVRTVTVKILRLPNIKTEDSWTLDAYLMGVNEITTTLNSCELVPEINCFTVVEIASAKLPSHWRNAWWEEVAAGRGEMSLMSLMKWLEQRPFYSRNSKVNLYGT